MNTQPGTRIITPNGRHGMISHPYTDDAGVRKAYVKLDEAAPGARKSVYLISELRPEPPTPHAYVAGAPNTTTCGQCAQPRYGQWSNHLPEPGAEFTLAAMAEAKAAAEGTNVWHATWQLRMATPPIARCATCGGPGEPRHLYVNGSHPLCTARAARGLATPALEWRTACPCNDDRLHPERLGLDSPAGAGESVEAYRG